MKGSKKTELLSAIDHIISECNGEKYNLADLMLSPLYLESIAAYAPATSPSRFFTTLKHTVFLAKERFLRLLNSNVISEQKGNIALCPATFSHIRQLYPVVKELKARQVSYIWILNKVILFSWLNKRNESCLLLKLPCNTIRGSSFIKERMKFYETLNNYPAKDKIKSTLGKVFRRNFSQTVSLISSFEEIASVLCPSALIVGNDLTLEGRVATAVFKHSEIYTSCVQHGEMSGTLDTKHIVNEFFVYGNSTKNILEKNNKDVNFIVSGAPYLDSENHSDDQLLDIFKQLDISDKYILVAFSGPGNNTSFRQHMMFIDSIFKMSVLFSEITFVVKLHPKDKLEYYTQKGLSNLKNVRIINNRSGSLPKEIFPWLKGSRLLITGASMTAIEAMKLEVPVITLDYLNEYTAIDFVKKRVSIKVKNEAELAVKLREVVGNSLNDQFAKERAKTYALNYFESHDCSASAFIANRIMIKRRA